MTRRDRPADRPAERCEACGAPVRDAKGRPHRGPYEAADRAIDDRKDSGR